MITGKITTKGQITIPSEFRKRLGTDVVEITMEGDKIVLKPLKKLGGVLQKYAIKNKPIEEVMKREKEVLVNALREKHSND